MLFKNLCSDIKTEFDNLEIKGITCDSRKVSDGYVYICIKGAVNDGHNFAASAMEKGAAVIVAEKPTGCKNEVIVEDTHAFFATASAKWFDNPADKLKLIGVSESASGQVAYSQTPVAGEMVMPGTLIEVSFTIDSGETEEGEG